MKTILIAINLLLVNCSLLALDVKWTVTLSDLELPSVPVSSAFVGVDGSAFLYYQDADTLCWFDSDGGLQELIFSVARSTSGASFGDAVIVSESFLMIPVETSSGDDFTKVYKKTESGYSEETISGNYPNNKNIGPRSAYYLSYDSSQLTVYTLPDFGQSNDSLGVSMAPDNAIVISTSSQRYVSVQLQSSLNLEDWTNTNSGYFSISNDSPRFFRVKAELE